MTILDGCQKRSYVARPNRHEVEIPTIVGIRAQKLKRGLVPLVGIAGCFVNPHQFAGVWRDRFTSRHTPMFDDGTSRSARTGQTVEASSAKLGRACNLSVAMAFCPIALLGTGPHGKV